MDPTPPAEMTEVRPSVLLGQKSYYQAVLALKVQRLNALTDRTNYENTLLQKYKNSLIESKDWSDLQTAQKILKDVIPFQTLLADKMTSTQALPNNQVALKSLLDVTDRVKVLRHRSSESPSRAA